MNNFIYISNIVTNISVSIILLYYYIYYSNQNYICN